MMRFNQLSLRLLECNIDDMNPEIFPYVMERLFSAGAKDVWLKPIVMKNGRPANTLSVLCTEELSEALAAIVFSETTTIGIRKTVVERYELAREEKTVVTKFGELQVKVAYDNDGNEMNSAPEYRSCQEVALKRKISLKTIFAEVSSALSRQKDKM